MTAIEKFLVAEMSLSEVRERKARLDIEREELRRLELDLLILGGDVEFENGEWRCANGKRVSRQGVQFDRNRPVKMSFEAFAHCVRERNSLCIECGMLIVGVAINHEPYSRDLEATEKIECPRCEQPAYGICTQWERKHIEVADKTRERAEREQRLLKSGLGSFEKGGFEFVWVDGEYETVTVMTDERIAVLTERAEKMTPKEREAILERWKMQEAARERARVREPAPSVSETVFADGVFDAVREERKMNGEYLWAVKMGWQWAHDEVKRHEEALAKKKAEADEREF